jgi:hypothetical protein
MDNYPPSPWYFYNDDKCMASPDGKFRIHYGELMEVGMGAPLGGECYCIFPGEIKVRISDFAGGTPLWNSTGKQVAIPLWRKGGSQKMGVFDTETKTLHTYVKLFRVIEFHSFEGNLITGKDSPDYQPSRIDFDITKETIESSVVCG